MATCDPPDFLLPCCQLFWSTICGKQTCGPFNKVFGRKIQTYQRLGRKLVLRHITQMELCSMNTIYISMLGYIKKQLLKSNDIMRWIQHCPYSPESKRYGANAQSLLPSNNTQKLTNSKIKQLQKVVRSILYYAQAVDMMELMALSTIASKQTKETECTLEKAYQVHDYLATCNS